MMITILILAFFAIQILQLLFLAAIHDAVISQIKKERTKQGWKLVPIEPTDEMIINTIPKGYHVESSWGKSVAIDYKAMLSAAPTPTPAPICKSCTNGMSYGVDGEYPCPKCHGNNAPTEKVERIEGVFPCPFEWFTRRVNAIRHKDEGLTFYMSPKEIERVNEAYRAYLKQQSGETEKVDFNIVLDNVIKHLDNLYHNPLTIDQGVAIEGAVKYLARHYDFVKKKD